MEHEWNIHGRVITVIIGTIVVESAWHRNKNYSESGIVIGNMSGTLR